MLALLIHCDTQGTFSSRRIEHLDPRRRDRRERHGAGRPIPGRERQHQQHEQDGRAAGVADPERAVGEVRHRGPERRGRDDHQPVEPAVAPPCCDLRADQDGKHHEEDRAPERVAQAHRHRDRVATGLAQRRRGHLDDPEQPGDFRNLAVAPPLGPAHPGRLARRIAPSLRIATRPANRMGPPRPSSGVRWGRTTPQNGSHATVANASRPHRRGCGPAPRRTPPAPRATRKLPRRLRAARRANRARRRPRG